MNESENKTAPSVEATEKTSALASQLQLLQLALIILSGTFATYLYIQVHRARIDLTVLKQVFLPMDQQFVTQEKPLGDAFIGKLSEYGRTHADFLPILKKYQIPVATAAPPPAALAPAPAKPAAPAPKK